MRKPWLSGGRWFGADGELDGIVRVDAPTRRAGQEALERVIEEHAAHGTDPDVMRRVFARMDLPETLPAFQALLIDRTGWIWAELFRLDDEDPSTWMVFSPDGQAHGMVNLPRDLEVHEIAKDHVLGRWVDDLGVEYVRRYRLERSVPEGPAAPATSKARRWPGQPLGGIMGFAPRDN